MAVPGTRQRLWAAGLAAALATGAACGGGGGADPKKDRAAAEKAAPKAGDLPSGWSSRPHEKLPGEDELGLGIARCLGISAPSGRATAVVRSPDYTQTLATVSSVITFVKSEGAAKTDADALLGPRFADCARPLYEKQMHEVAPEGNTVSDATTSKLSYPTYGDRSAVDRVSAMVHIPILPSPLPITVDIVRIFKGRAEAEITVVSPGAPLPPELTGKVASAVATRL